MNFYFRFYSNSGSDNTEWRKKRPEILHGIMQ